MINLTTFLVILLGTLTVINFIAQQPLALVTWGKRLTMSTVNIDIVKEFIKQNALQGPEKISRDGQYDTKLLAAAEMVSDTEDTDLCPEERLKSVSLFW